MTLPGRLDDIAAELRDVPPELQLEVLLDHAERLPDLPAWLTGDDAALERVVECRAPVRLAVVVAADGTVDVHVDCPREAPTVRAFGSILVHGLRGATTEEVAQVPDDLADHLGVGEALSTLRAAGMAAMVRRLKRQVAVHAVVAPRD